MSNFLAWQELFESNANRYDFFQALRLIECAQPDKPRIGTALVAKQDPVRFGQEPELAFRPGAISRYERGVDGRLPHLKIQFFGLLGPNGPMPIHLTEYVRDRLRNSNDPTLARFLDLFHHRMVSLFYRAWSMGQPTVNWDRPESDRFTTYVGSLFGIGEPSLRNRDGLTDNAKLHFAGYLANQSRHAVGLAAILREYFRLPTTIEQYVGHWMELPKETRSCLGLSNGVCQLGVSTVLGSQVWDRQHKFRIVLGPLSFQEFCRLLPSGDSIKRLVAWVRQYVGLALDWDLRLILKQNQAPSLLLGRGSRLGWTTWLGRRDPARHADELLISASLISIRSL